MLVGARFPSDAATCSPSSIGRASTRARCRSARRRAAGASPRSMPGLYLRTDFWVRIMSGGSYGHTCYVAKELAAVDRAIRLSAAAAIRLLDTLGVTQVVMIRRPNVRNEDAIVARVRSLLPDRQAALEALRPAYIYERLCLGNYVARAAQPRAAIPYIVEYNGSEISMRRSFDGTATVYEDVYLEGGGGGVPAGDADLASSRRRVKDRSRRARRRRGKILVNPNGADLDSYAPRVRREKRSAARSSDSPTTIAWSGSPARSAAGTASTCWRRRFPRICAGVPAVQFLLIGDGNHKPLVDAEVERHRLSDRVRSVGRVPQEEGARLLKACDIFVSPHNSHMVDSKFFGSPTKIFEYMAMGGGIVGERPRADRRGAVAGAAAARLSRDRRRA